MTESKRDIDIGAAIIAHQEKMSALKRDDRISETGSESDFEPYQNLSAAHLSPPRTPISVRSSAVKPVEVPVDSEMAVEPEISTSFQSLELGLRKMNELQSQINILRSKFRTETEDVQKVSDSLADDPHRPSPTVETKRERLEPVAPDSPAPAPTDDDDLTTEIQLLEELRLDLRAREDELAVREDTLDGDELHLEEKEAALGAREAALEEREAAVAAREAELGEDLKSKLHAAEVNAQVKAKMVSQLEAELKRQGEACMRIVTDTEDFMGRYQAMETSLKARIKELEGRMANMDGEAAEERAAAAQDRNDDLLRALGQRTKQMKAMDADHQAAMAAVNAEAQRVQQALADRDATVTTLQEQVREGAAQMQALTAQLAATQASLDAAMESTPPLTPEASRREEDLKELLLDASRTEGQLRGMEEELGAAKARVAELEASGVAGGVDKSRAELRGIVTAQQGQINDLVSEVNDLKKRTSASTVETQHLKADLETARKMVQSLTRAEQTAAGRLNDGTDVCQALRVQLAERDNRVTEMERLIRDARQKSETISQSVLDELFEARDEAAAARSDLLRLKAELSGIESEMRDGRGSMAGSSVAGSPMGSGVQASQIAAHRGELPRGYKDSPIPREPLESAKLMPRGATAGPSLFAALGGDGDSVLSRSAVSDIGHMEPRAVMGDPGVFPDESVLDYIKRRKSAIMGKARK